MFCGKSPLAGCRLGQSVGTPRLRRRAKNRITAAVHFESKPILFGDIGMDVCMLTRLLPCAQMYNMPPKNCAKSLGRRPYQNLIFSGIINLNRPPLRKTCTCLAWGSQKNEGKKEHSGSAGGRLPGAGRRRAAAAAAAGLTPPAGLSIFLASC